MALTTQTLARASDALATQRAQLVRAYVDAAKTMYGSLRPGDWWNDAVIVAVAGRLGLLELSMIRRLSRLSVSYADTILREMGVDPKGPLPSLAYPREGVTPMDVAMRPARMFRHLQAQRPDVKPKDWPSKDSEIGQVVSGWLDDIYAMLETEVATDATAASNRATVDRFAGSGVATYRRIIHPELSTTGTCGLCIAAADRYYSTKTLMPLHDRCKCTVAPVLEGKGGDPGLNLTTQDLKALYKAAGSTKAADLKAVRVTTVEHGELGPILTQTGTVRETPTPRAKRKDDDGTPYRFGMDKTPEQLRAMRDEAMFMAGKYKELADSGKEWLEFEYQGHKRTFYRTDHLERDRKLNDLTIKLSNEALERILAARRNA